MDQKNKIEPATDFCEAVDKQIKEIKNFMRKSSIIDNGFLNS